jgi:hypothetical protein
MTFLSDPGWISGDGDSVVRRAKVMVNVVPARGEFPGIAERMPRETSLCLVSRSGA